jgi:hypothetical protein
LQEEHSDKFHSDKWQSQPVSHYATPKAHSPDGESFFKTKLKEIFVEHHTAVTSSKSDENGVTEGCSQVTERRHSDSDADENVDALFSEIAERKGSIVSDAKFDLILASLQSLAIEIERDFRSDCESSGFAPIQRTKSENNLSTIDQKK